VLALLLVRTLFPFILSPKAPKTSFQKNSLFLTLSVTLVIGGLSFFKGSIAAFYYPVIMSLAMGGLFTLSLVFPPSFIERVARLQDPTLPPSALTYTKMLTKAWVGFCLINAAIAYGTIIYGDLEIWTLYNGLISYILMGTLLGGEFLFRSFYKKKQQERIFQNFTPLSKVHQKTKEAWRDYWNSPEWICQNYPAYIDALVRKIEASGAKHIFLISEDRALFLAGFMATIQAGKDLVLPSTDKSELLRSIVEDRDIILSDQHDLSTLNLPFMSLDQVRLFNPRPLKEINPQKTVITFYTSGSSGTPKAIKKRLSELEAEVAELQKTWPMTNLSSTLCSTVPHHHVYGLLFSLLWPVSAGIPLKRETISHWDELFPENSQKNILISSPAHLQRVPEGFQHPFQQVFSSGGPLSYQNVQNILQTIGIIPTEVYGSTETGGIAYRQQTVENTPWTCFPTVRVYADDASNLHVQSPYIDSFLSEGEFFETADRVILQNKSQFFLLGRSDRVVKIEGKRLSLVELEGKLQGINDVRAACALLIPSEKRHEVGAVIVLTEQGKHNLKTLGKIAFVRQLRLELQSYFELVTLPRRWRFVDQIPENAQGKRPVDLLSSLFQKDAA
jgi:acyl-CoA synthetase (AMP-forming)/AMP-acid ligase II